MSITSIHTELTELNEQIKLIRENINNRRMLAILISNDGEVQVVTPGNFPVITLLGALDLAKEAILYEE